ncbi:MAG: hypothetical protein LAT80_03020 [Balneolaceae bacterium]|nr:hypothetical protein [Balneolaceae bacterium]
MKNSYQSVADMREKNQVDNLRRLISEDMRYIGFGPGNDLLNFSDNHIRFRARVDGQNRVISWRIMPGNSFNVPTNPNLKGLRRMGPYGDQNNTQLNFPVSRFTVQAFSDEQGTQPTDQKDQVRSILIELEVESREPVGYNPDGTPRYARASWRHLFKPDNFMF